MEIPRLNDGDGLEMQRSEQTERILYGESQEIFGGPSYA
jgi:hypothetical protein